MSDRIKDTDKRNYINLTKSLKIGESRVYNVTPSFGHGIKLLVDRIISDMIYMDFEVDIGEETTTVTRIEDRRLPVIRRGPKALHDFTGITMGQVITLEIDQGRQQSVRNAVLRAVAATGWNITIRTSGRTVTVTRLEPGAATADMRGYGIPNLALGGRVQVELVDGLTIGAVRRVASYYSDRLNTRFCVGLTWDQKSCVIVREGTEQELDDRKMEDRAPEIVAPSQAEIDEQNRIAAQVLAAAIKQRDDEF